MKKELLSPAGNMECLKQAVYNGCDAVYIACKSFGARKFAANFSNEEIVEAIKFCHLYGVKVYVTMNTLVKNTEVDSFIEQARFLHINGVDALIVQDFGMICLLREKFPNLEIHASTQANTSSYETCKFYYDLGVKRVVFSRELSIDEIDSIDVPIEKEAFIHGALCISYSGNCLMSSMLGGRSGNRGECAGCCRMPFSLIQDGKVLSSGKYLLSTKELNTTECIDRLMNSSVYSFKIEGRMKSPLYVGFITRLYRRLIDGEKFDLLMELDKLKCIFNREFTVGRMFNETDNGLMNVKSPNHVGLNIGSSSIYKDKIKIKLDEGKVLNQYDAIRFVKSDKGMIINFLYDKDMKLCNSCTGICYVDNKLMVNSDDFVSKTQDHLLEKEFENINRREVNISFSVVAHVGEKLYLEVNDGINKLFEYSDIVDESINASVTKDTLIEKLSKLGDTPFVCNDFNIDIDNNIFIPMKKFNEIRRTLIEKLIEVRENNKVEVIENEVTFDSFDDSNLGKNISCFVNTFEQLKACLDSNIQRIYVNDKELYEKYKENKFVYKVIDRCSRNYSDVLDNNVFVSDYMDFSKFNILGNYSLNVFNIYTAYYLRKHGLNIIPLSVELNEDELFSFIKSFERTFGNVNFEILKYGRVENMIIKGNIIKLDAGYNNYYLKDFKGREFPVYFDGINTHVLNSEIRNDKMLDINNCYSRFDFYDEDYDDVLHIIKSYGA